jgi:hypothetical protein
MGKEGQQRVWRLYGRFCGLMVCGSCFGAVTWATRMMQLKNFYEGHDAELRGDHVQRWSLRALSYSWAAVFNVSYAIEFLCLSAANLMVLDRMVYYAAGQHRQDERMRKRWSAGGRMVMAVVVLGNAVGLAANIAAAVRRQRAAEAASTASTLFAANSTQAARKYESLSRAELQDSLSVASVQSFCEVGVLMLIVVAFVAVGVYCARRISFVVIKAIYKGIDAALAAEVAGRRQKLQMVVTTAFVFVAFVVRSVQSTMAAVSRQLQDSGRICPGVTDLCDPSCNNVFAHIVQWNAYTPELQLSVVLISSPLALLVALWGVTSSLALQLMKQDKRVMTILGPTHTQDLLGATRG